MDWTLDLFYAEAYRHIMDIPTKSGVYKITIGRRYYFGSTKGSLSERKDQHEYDLQRGRHSNRRMQNSWNKYRSLQFEVLIVCEPEFAREYEQYFLDKYFGGDDCLNMKECSRGGLNIEKIDLELAKKLYYQDKWSLEKIGKSMGGLSFATISARMTEAGCKLRVSNQVARIELPPDIADLYRDGASLRDIADYFKVTHSVVRSRLVDLGVDLRGVGSPKPVDDADLLRMYVNERMSTLAIAQKVGMTKSGVSKRLREAAETDDITSLRK